MSHCPVRSPSTVFGVCVRGQRLGPKLASALSQTKLLPRQFKSPSMWLLLISMASGSANWSLMTLTLSPTLFRITPSQQDCKPLTESFPPTVLSSYVLYAGGPFGPSGNVLQLTPPPPPLCVTSPSILLLCANTISASLATRLPPTVSWVAKVPPL